MVICAGLTGRAVFEDLETFVAVQTLDRGCGLANISAKHMANANELEILMIDVQQFEFECGLIRKLTQTRGCVEK